MAYPVTLSEVKQHCRIDIDFFDDDQYIESTIIPYAVEHCTDFTNPSTLYTDASCPYKVKMAILKLCDDMYKNRGSYESNNSRKTDIVTRLLMFHKKIVW